jgi:hypothetical protein
VPMAGCPIGFESIVLSVPDDMIPIGGIISWSGAVVDIPSNYNLCDGTCGTPDLRGNFIRGAGGGLDPGDTGGTINHTHSEGGNAQVVNGAGPYCWTTGPSAASDNIPPYHALAYIQRIS